MAKRLQQLTFIGLLLGLGILMASCVEGESDIDPVPPTPTVASFIAPKRPSVAPTPTPATRAFPLPASTLEPVAARPSSQSCIDCHTDQELLKATATEVEAVETQSEGEG
jgi:hypothetical protein